MQKIEPQVAEIRVQPGQFVEDPRYNADAHQHLLARPNSWCGKTRPKEPLLADALRIATGDANEPLAAFRATHGIPMMNREAIVVIRDESICERAAKAYDRAVHSGDLLAEHTRLRAVIVVKLETVFLVEEARPRGQIWEVKFFDLHWKDRGFNYGAGA